MALITVLACRTLQLIMPENEASAVSTVTMPALILIMLPCTSTWPGAVIFTPLEVHGHGRAGGAADELAAAGILELGGDAAGRPEADLGLAAGRLLDGDAGPGLADQGPAIDRIAGAAELLGRAGAAIPERADHDRIARIALEEAYQDLAADVGQHEGAVARAGERHRDPRPKGAGLAAKAGPAEEFDLDPVEALGIVDRDHLGEADRLLQHLAEAVGHRQPPK